MSKYNCKPQMYKGITLKLIGRNYSGYKAKRYTLNNTNQNIWIPNQYLEADGTLKKNANLDWLFKKYDARHKIDITLGRA